MLLSEIFDNNQLINKYIGNFYIYYNDIKTLIDSFDDVTKTSIKHPIKIILNYEFVFQLNLNEVSPNINLESINLIKSNFNYDSMLCSNKIKKIDYDIFFTKFDVDYLFTVYDYPYFIVNIKKNNEYKQHYSFYENKILILKNMTNNELTYFDFEKNIIQYNYLLDKNYKNNQILNESVDESVNESFFINENKIIINDGPIYILTKKIRNNSDNYMDNSVSETNKINHIILDDIEYEITKNTTLNIEFIYKTIKL